MFEKFQALELKYDVEKIKAKGIQMWPLLRIYLANQVVFNKDTAVKPNKEIFKAALKYAFLGFSNFFKPTDHLFFSSSDQRKKIGLKYIDRADLVCAKLNRSLIIEMPSNSKHFLKDEIPDSKISSKFLFYLITWFMAKLHRNVIIESEDILKRIIAESSTELNYQWNIKLFLSQRSLMTYFLKWKKIKSLMMITPYTNLGYVYAAKSIGIPVIEFQHGSVNSAHFAYNANKKMDRCFYPDALLTFGLKEVNSFGGNNFYIQKENVFPVGSFIIDQIVQRSPSDQKFTELTKSYNKVVAFAAQDAMEEMYIPFFKEIAFKASNTAFILMTRFRTKEYYTQFNFSDNVLFFDWLSTYEIIYLSDVHSTINSTTTAEAPSLGTPNLLLNVENRARQYWENNIDNEICFYADTPDQYVEILNNLSSHKKSEVMKKNEQIIVPGFEKNIAVILPNLIKEMHA